MNSREKELSKFQSDSASSEDHLGQIETNELHFSFRSTIEHKQTLKMKVTLNPKLRN